MIIINLKKIIAAALSAVTMMTSVMLVPSDVFENSTTIMSASATSDVSKPVVTKGTILSNRIELTLENLSSYSKTTKFQVYVNSTYVKTYTYAKLKANNSICIYNDGSKFLKGDTKYTVKIRAVSGKVKSSFKSVSVKTPAYTYYKIQKGAKIYTLTNGKLKSAGTVSQIQYVKSVLCDADGTRVNGKSIKKYSADYLLINEGEYKGKYVKNKADYSRTTETNAKIQKVVSYAVGMNGGRYVSCGESYRATDCSGLTMLSYRQVGVEITHNAYLQAKAGKASSMSKIKAGDIIICNNYGHAAMYIGDGKIIHAMNSYYGIRIQNVENIKYCGTVNAVRTIIY